MPEFQPSKFVAFTKRIGYSIIKWNRPDRKNAIIPEMQDTASHYLKLSANDDTIKLVVLTGTGEYYTSGADFLASIARERAKHDSNVSDSRSPRESNKAFRNFVATLITFPKPIVVAVNGPAIGMGVSTLPLCDVVYASSDSTFVTPFSRIGVVPEACSSYTFPIVMGYAKANEMLLFNRTLSAVEAHNCGLVADVFPKESFMEEVEKRVNEFMDNPMMSLIYGKRLLRKRDEQKLLQINKEECERLDERFASEDVAMQAVKFMEKRQEIRRRRQAKL